MSKGELKLQIELLYKVDAKIEEVIDDVFMVFKSLLKHGLGVAMASHEDIIVILLEEHIHPDSLFNRIREVIGYIEKAVEPRFPDKIRITYKY